MGRTVVAGNWKMNHGPRDAEAFARALRLPHNPELEVILFPPALSLSALEQALAERDFSVSLRLGVQNIHWEESGAFTGEQSAPMVAQTGATHVLVGHSERRQIFGETDDDTRRKLAVAAAVGLIPVLCVGETLEEREGGRLEEVLRRQVEGALGPASTREALSENGGFLLAYEPVWAIGTGETATPDDASHAHGLLRKMLQDRLGSDSVDPRRVPILYGGSVKPGNAAELLEGADVDGVLVGGASLEPDSFQRIAEAAG
jgi:triosephosphate isomerase (TIM)